MSLLLWIERVAERYAPAVWHALVDRENAPPPRRALSKRDLYGAEDADEAFRKAKERGR
jgi:hypothetical protein